LRVAAGVINLLASLQSFLNLEKKYGQHLTAAKKITTLKREIEEAKNVIANEPE